MCSAVDSDRVVRTLHDLFDAYDANLDSMGILKVDTVGARLPSALCRASSSA